MRRAWIFGLLAALMFCDMGLGEIRYKAAPAKIAAAAVPAEVLKKFSAGFHMEGDVLNGAPCDRPGQFMHVLGWYHASSFVSEADAANGVRQVDVYLFKVNLYREKEGMPWSDIGNDPFIDTDNRSIFTVIDERMVKGPRVVVIAGCDFTY